MAFKDTKIVKAFTNAFASTEIKEKEKVISQLVNAIKRQRTLYRKEIVDWKIARATALDPINPRRKPLIDIFEDMLTDAYIFGLYENRKLRISNKSFAIKNKKGEVDDEKTKLFKKSWFNDFIKYAVEAYLQGYSLVYPKDLDKNGYIKKLSLVYRDHIVPERMEILENTYDTKGVKFNELPYSKWVVWLEHENFLGLLDKAVPLWIFKKHSWQNWDEFEEMFGIPMRTAKTASTDKRVLDEIDGWLQEFGSANWARLPDGVEFEIKESNSRDAFNVFNEKRKACNEELAMLFEGNAEAAKDSGSRAKSETIIDSTQAMIALDDEVRVQFIVNDYLLPFLIGIGYPLAEDDEFIWNENTKSTPEERLTIFKGVKELGYKVKKEQIETELDVELEEIEDPEPPKDDTQKNKKSKGSVPTMRNPPHPPIKENFNTPHVHDSNCGCEAKESYREIDFQLLNALSKDEEDFLKKFFENPNSIKWSYKEFKATHAPLLEAIKEGFNGVDTDFESDDHKLIELFQSNIHRFGVDKTLKEIMDLNQILKTSKDFSEFRKRALVLFPNYKEKWLRSEWEQAWAVSRMGKRYNEMMANIDIAPFWRLVAVLDKGTTKICRSLHNHVFSKLDKKAWQFLPPNHWGCRSDAEDVLGSYKGKIISFDDAVTLDPDGYANMQKQGFAVNWGDTGEVFSATQSYLHKTGVEPIDFLSLSYKDYDLKDVAQMSKLLNVPGLKIDFDALTDRSGLAKMIDYDDMPVWLEQSVFLKMNSDLRSAILDIITTPSEVYYNEVEGTLYKNYWKFYNGKSVKVNTMKIPGEITKITSIDTVENPDQFRKGLLLYTPKEHIAKRLTQFEKYGSDYKKISFNKENGGFIVKHKGHLASELDNNLLTAKSLENLGKNIELLPVSSDKTADAKVNGVEWEFKLLTNYTNLSSRLKKEIARALKQSSNVLIHINNKFTIEDVIIGIREAVANDKNNKLKFLSILLNDGNYYTFSRKEIEMKEHIKVLKK